MSASVWKRNSLGKIGNFSNGVNKPKEAFGHGTKFVNISDVFLPSLKIRDLDKVEISDNEKSFYGLKKDDLLFVRSSVKPDGVGYNTIFEDSNEDIVFCGFVIRFRKSSYEIDAHFLNFLLRSPEYRKQIISFSTVSANTNINQVSLKRIEIEYPQDIKEQKHISDILSTCDTVIQKTQKTIDKYRAIKQGMMQDLFTRGLTKDGKLRPSYKEAPELYKESELGMIPKEWNVNTTNSLAQRLWIGLVTTMTSHYVDEGIPLIRNSDISDNKIEDVEIFLDYDFAKANASREVHLGDVVTVHTGDIGTSSVINEKYDGAHGFATINTTVNKTIINEDYYCRYMNSFEFKKQALRAITGDGRQNLNIYDFINLLIPYPIDIEEQITIVNRLKSIDSIIQKEEEILAKYKKIKTGLMAQLLTPSEDAEIIDETGE